MELPQSRVDIINFIRYQYSTNFKFYNKIEIIVNKFSENKNIIRELALFGESFLQENGSSIPSEFIKAKREEGNSVPSFISTMEQYIPSKSLIIKRNPYDLRGSSFFDLSTMEPIESIDYIIFRIREALKE